MLYGRIVDNKEIARTIWKICTEFNNDLYSVERFALRWMLCITLNDLYYVEWFVLRWMICSTLNDLYYVEWFILRWIICIALNDLYYLEWFVQRWMIFCFLEKFVRPQMIFTAFKDLYCFDLECDRRFAQCWIIWATMNHWVSAFE